MMIRIRYSDGRFDMVKAARLDHLIETEQIEGFKRANGWITLGVDPVRNKMFTNYYPGTERRGIVDPHVLNRDEILSANLYAKATDLL